MSRLRIIAATLWIYVICAMTAYLWQFGQLLGPLARLLALD